MTCLQLFNCMEFISERHIRLFLRYHFSVTSKLTWIECSSSVVHDLSICFDTSNQDVICTEIPSEFKLIIIDCCQTFFLFFSSGTVHVYTRILMGKLAFHGPCMPDTVMHTGTLMKVTENYCQRNNF